MVQFKLDNYHKQTPRHWKAIGDTALYSIPIVDSLLMAMPDIPHKEWLVWGWSVLASAIKIATKYISDIEKEKEVQDVNTDS